MFSILSRCGNPCFKERWVVLFKLSLLVVFTSLNYLNLKYNFCSHTHQKCKAKSFFFHQLKVSNKALFEFSCCTLHCSQSVYKVKISWARDVREQHLLFIWCAGGTTSLQLLPCRRLFYALKDLRLGHYTFICSDSQIWITSQQA